MDLERKAVERIRTASEMSLHYYGKPLVCTYSGGKDSDVVLELFRRSGIPFEVHNSHTTADAPQTVYHIREVFRSLELDGVRCSTDFHRQQDGSMLTMWRLIRMKMIPPLRTKRYCCSVLKETGCAGRMIATGVRWAESRGRKERGTFENIAAKKSGKVKVDDEKMLLTDNDSSRRLFEQCRMKAKTVVNPIIDWLDRDVWDYYWHECRMHNPLYRMGYFRVGCIGCPMAGRRRSKEFADFPKYRQAYIRAFDGMLEERKERGLHSRWKSGLEVFLWWMEDESIPGQISIEEYLLESRKDML